MGAWAKVVSEPLGLAGFALFLIFAYLGKTKTGDKRKWISPVAFLCAASTLVGGLSLAYLQITKPAPPPPAAKETVSAPAEPQINHVQQTSTGSGSPNVQGVNGDVTITIDGNPSKPAAQKATPKHP